MRVDECVHLLFPQIVSVTSQMESSQQKIESSDRLQTSPTIKSEIPLNGVECAHEGDETDRWQRCL